MPTKTDKVISPIACVRINHQNQLEQMANEAMFATACPDALRPAWLRPFMDTTVGQSPPLAVHQVNK
jgi:hypothetical protein